MHATTMTRPNDDDSDNGGANANALLGLDTLALFIFLPGRMASAAAELSAYISATHSECSHCAFDLLLHHFEDILLSNLTFPFHFSSSLLAHNKDQGYPEPPTPFFSTIFRFGFPASSSFSARASSSPLSSSS